MNFLKMACTATPSTGRYRLDDDGTRAAEFGVEHLATIAPAYNRATYMLTSDEHTLLAAPASVIAAPGLVTLVEGVPLVCGFTIHAVPSTGGLNEFYFQLYNYGGSGSVLAHARVAKDSNATTGSIQGEFGTFPPSVVSFGTAFTGDLTGAKVAIQMSLSSGNLTCKLWVNGVLKGTSTPIATDGGAIAVMQVRDDSNATPAGVIDIECAPYAAQLAVGYGTFDSGAVDMVGTVI